MNKDQASKEQVIKKATRIIPLLVGILVVVVFVVMRVVPGVEWNAWTVDYARYVFDGAAVQAGPTIPPAGHERSNLWLAKLALANGDAEGALALIETQAMRGDPFALRIQAEAFEQQGDYPGALQIFKRIGDYNLLIAFGQKAANNGQLEQAEAAFRAALEIDPEMGILPLSGYLMDTAGDLQGTVALLNDSLATYPDSSQRLYWYRRLGNILRRHDNLGEAEQVYQAAAIEYPDDITFLIGLGWVHYEQGEGLEKALIEFQQAIEIAPDKGDGYHAIGEVLTDAGRFDEADTWYQHAIEHDPTNWIYALDRANNARQAGAYALAISIYQAALSTFPDHSAELNYDLAWAYRLDSQPENARTSIEQALTLMKPLNEYYCLRAGLIYEWRGETDLAVEAYQRALTINPNSSAAQNALDRLSTP
jgi:tetratricopeptide (TPR) repeat protein